MSTSLYQKDYCFYEHLTSKLKIVNCGGAYRDSIRKWRQGLDVECYNALSFMETMRT